MLNSQFFPLTGNPQETNFRCYHLHPAVLATAQNYANAQGLDCEEQVYDIAAEVTKAVNGILQCACQAKAEGKEVGETCLNDCTPLPKFNSLVQETAASILKFEVNPIGRQYRQLQMSGSVLPYAIFRVEWGNQDPSSIESLPEPIEYRKI